MKNKIILFELYKIWNDFNFDMKSKQITEDKLKEYLKMINKINDKNITYWINEINKK